MMVKVCGMRDQQNIAELEGLGADWMGLIFHPTSPRFVESDLKFTKEKLQKIGVFVNATDEYIEARVNKYGLGGVQFHGQEPPSQCRDFRDRGLIVIKAFAIHKDFLFDSTIRYENCCDYFLFDTKTQLPGGSGKTFAWPILQAYRGKTPFFLSGGIGKDHLKALKKFYHPKMAGIDVNSRFESRPGVKIISDLKYFIDEYKH